VIVGRNLPRKILVAVQACLPFNWPSVQAAREGLADILIPCRAMPNPLTEALPGAAAKEQSAVLQREAGLHRNLTPRQLSMIAIGGAIGTGLFLGSAISVKLAGPGVLLSYLAAAAIALCLMWALGEMSVAHPVAGSFGVYAEMYVHPLAGFTMRYSYWLAQMIATGSEVVAASIYCRHWFPNVPSWLWIAGFSAALVYVNARSVASFGEFEYWFAMIKVLTITVFLILGAALLLGVGFPRVGVSNYTVDGGFLPNGWRGVGLGVAMAIFSFLGIEVVAVTSGEAKDPTTALPRALRWTLGRLGLFYIGGLTIVVGIVPWNQVGLGESPFVRVFERVGIPAAAGIMNFVVLTAALSSTNCNLYLMARMLFSLSRGGYAPAALGRLSKRGTPIPALLVSSLGMCAALFMDHWFHESAYVYMLGAAFLGGIFVWQMIFVTHLAFRRRTAKWPKPPVRFAPDGPWSSLIGFIALTSVLISTWWVPGLRITLVAGVPWLAFISLCYLCWRKTHSPKAPLGVVNHG
jgi:amino acid transporter, AAT family